MPPDDLPSHFIDLVQDALLKSFWRKNALLNFLRRHKISETFLGTWQETETKRTFVARLLPKVEAHSKPRGLHLSGLAINGDSSDRDLVLPFLDRGEWVFSYSDEFRSQTELNPIVDFPDVKKRYRSRTLWPFFALRIPSPEQPAVREFIRSQPHEKVDEGILLKEFGERSIANPFRLVPI